MQHEKDDLKIEGREEYQSIALKDVTFDAPTLSSARFFHRPTGTLIAEAEWEV